MHKVGTAMTLAMMEFEFSIHTRTPISLNLTTLVHTVCFIPWKINPFSFSSLLFFFFLFLLLLSKFSQSENDQSITRWTSNYIISCKKLCFGLSFWRSKQLSCRLERDLTRQKLLSERWWLNHNHFQNWFILAKAIWEKRKIWNDITTRVSTRACRQRSTTVVKGWNPLLKSFFFSTPLYNNFHVLFFRITFTKGQVKKKEKKIGSGSLFACTVDHFRSVLQWHDHKH